MSKESDKIKVALKEDGLFLGNKDNNGLIVDSKGEVKIKQGNKIDPISLKK